MDISPKASIESLDSLATNAHLFGIFWPKNDIYEDIDGCKKYEISN